MFLAFGSSGHRSTVSFVTGGQAWRVDKWNKNQPPNRLEIGMVPTVVMEGTFPNVDINPMWTRATIILIRPEIVPNQPIMPPSQKIRLVDKPEFSLNQFYPNGTPDLNYKQFTTPGPYINMDVWLVQLATVEELQHVSPNKRLVSLPFPGVKFPDPVPVTSAPNRPGATSTMTSADMRAIAGPTPSPVGVPPSGSSSSTTPGSNASDSSGSRKTRLKRTPLRTPEVKPVISTRLLAFSPELKPGGTRWTVGGTGDDAKRHKASLTVDLTINQSQPGQVQRPQNINETIDISSDMSQDPDDSKQAAPQDDDEDNDQEEVDDHAKDKDYEPRKGRKRPHK